MNKCYVLLLLTASAVIGQIGAETADEAKSDKFLWDVLNECINGIESISNCLKFKALNQFEKHRFASPRSLSNENIEYVDRAIVKRFQKYLRQHDFQIQLPEFFFQSATLNFKANKPLSDFQVTFPTSSIDEARSTRAARDMMQQKMLLPFLMMLKMKMKMMTPMMLTLVSIKATKALLISKLSLLLVIGFLASQMMKKLGMHIPMIPTESPTMSTPPSAYGPPSSNYGPPSSNYGPPSSNYGPPSFASSSSSLGSPPSLSYGEPSPPWEPSPSSSSSGSSYSKTYDSHQLAYSSYFPQNSPSKPSSPSSSSSSSASSSYSSSLS